MNLSKNGKRIGRPPGSKNAVTILEEAAARKKKDGARSYALAKSPKVLEAMYKEAIKGDVAAARLVLAYGLGSPEVESKGGSAPVITINVEKIDAQTAIGRQINADGEISAAPRTFEVQAGHAVHEGLEEDEARPS